MKELKETLRKRMKKELLSLSKPLYEHQSYQIAQSLYKDSLWQNANTIGITISNFPEVDTYQIIRKGWECGKKIAIPKCNPKTKEMKFRQLDTFNQLETVYYGLFEPIAGLTEDVLSDEIDLLIVPGIVYSRDGYRIGFGGGYFDRYLEGLGSGTISLAFSNQVVGTLPIENHDIPVEKIITEKEVIIIYA